MGDIAHVRAHTHTQLCLHHQCLFPDPFPLSRMFADQLNATGVSQLQSLSLIPAEEAESEESEDYY